jgi:hypothetical protein
MRIKHKSLKSFTTKTSHGDVVVGPDGHADVTEAQYALLTQPGMGFVGLEDVALPPPAPVSLVPPPPPPAGGGEDDIAVPMSAATIAAATAPVAIAETVTAEEKVSSAPTPPARGKKPVVSNKRR